MINDVSSSADSEGARPEAHANRRAVLHYKRGQDNLNSYVSSVKFGLMRYGLPLHVFNISMNLVRRIYRLHREHEWPYLLNVIASDAARFLDAGLTAEQLTWVVKECLETVGGSLMAGTEVHIRQAIEERAAEAKANGVRLSPICQAPEGVMENDEGTKNETTMNEPTSTDPVVALSASELAARVQEFLATKLENPGDAEPMAKDIAEAVVQAAKPVPAPARRKPQRRGRPAPSELSAADVTGQLTPLERFTKLGATTALRTALSGHQDIVNLVVAGRLCAKKTFDDLSQEYGLTKDEVLDIMTRMRAWVSRFTTYFDSEWYWKEEVGKYFIPAPRPIIKDGAK